VTNPNIIHFNIEKDYRDLVSQVRLKSIANTIINYFDLLNIELTISIVGEKKIHELNNDFRFIDSETDVLSFSADELNPETGSKYIGDIIISYPIAEKQSSSSHYLVSDELDLLTIHGLLHLIGYDHERKEEKKQMFAVQSKLVQLIKASTKKN
jgi:probable rRNA maturation factor